MGFFRSLAGSVRVELTSADKETVLCEISDSGIEVMDVETGSELTVRFTVSRSSLHRIQQIVRRKGDRLIVVERRGFFWPLWNLHRRPVLIGGLLLMLVLAFVVPGRVLFVRVEGNEHVPAQLILEAAQDAGIRFGASRRAVRSEKMKNELLGALPQLQWAGVNTAGCTAVISVRERAAEAERVQLRGITSIVASCDGIVTDCTATRGSMLCAAGQAVRKGQVLISGYLDNGLALTATRAEGEVFARTQHEVTVVTPSKVHIRGDAAVCRRNISLILGKKRINFMKGSGIYEGTCVKMYEEYCLTLPGGYQLPVTLVIEHITESDITTKPSPEAEAQQLLADFAKDYLRYQLVAAAILDAQENFTCADGLYRLSGHYACTEMIGREQSEQIGEFHGKTD